jgi:hypothetical protein
VEGLVGTLSEEFGYLELGDQCLWGCWGIGGVHLCVMDRLGRMCGGGLLLEQLEQLCRVGGRSSLSISRSKLQSTKMILDSIRYKSVRAGADLNV